MCFRHFSRDDLFVDGKAESGGGQITALCECVRVRESDIEERQKECDIFCVG